MGRIFGIFLIAAMLGGAILTYDNKHRAELAIERVAALRAQVADEKSAIAMLRAEWSVLTQPSRLQALTERFKPQLGLADAATTQIVSIDEVPTKLPVPAPGTDSKPVTASSRVTR